MKHVWVFLTTAVLSLTASAHDFWIEASPYRGQPGETSALRLFVGEAFAGASVPRIDDWFHRFDVAVPGDHTPRPTEGELGDAVVARVFMEKAGVYHVAYESKREFVDLKAAKFHDYLREEALDHIIDERQRLNEVAEPGREYYSRCAKTLLRAGDSGTTGLEVGLTLELIMEEPGAFRLLFRGRPLAGTRVRAISRAQPDQPIDAVTDEQGRVALALGAGGEWLVKAVHMQRADEADRHRADWRSWWASLTFRL